MQNSFQTNTRSAHLDIASIQLKVQEQESVIREKINQHIEQAVPENIRNGLKTKKLPDILKTYLPKYRRSLTEIQNNKLTSELLDLCKHFPSACQGTKEQPATKLLLETCFTLISEKYSKKANANTLTKKEEQEATEGMMKTILELSPSAVPRSNLRRLLETIEAKKTVKGFTKELNEFYEKHKITLSTSSAKEERNLSDLLLRIGICGAVEEENDELLQKFTAGEASEKLEKILPKNCRSEIMGKIESVREVERMKQVARDEEFINSEAYRQMIERDAEIWSGAFCHYD